jgi:hypothetical protein
MKHRSILYSILLTVSLFTSCNKYSQTRTDISGNNYIAGIAYLLNDYSTNSLLTPLSNHIIQIKDTTEVPSPDYFYSVPSDSNGHFIFPDLRSGIVYTVFALDTLSGISFYGSIKVLLRNDTIPVNDTTLILSPDSAQQNGFIYTVTDSTGDIIANCQLCVYSSPLLFDQDSCSGAIFNLTTNTFGMASQFTVFPATYMTQAMATFGNYTLTGQDSSLIIPLIGPPVKHTIIVGRHS